MRFFYILHLSIFLFAIYFIDNSAKKYSKNKGHYIYGNVSKQPYT
jgi:hypothetical protein